MILVLLWPRGNWQMKVKTLIPPPSPLIFSVIFPGNGLEGIAPNLNPPISVLIFQTFANSDPFVSITIWRIASIVIFIAALIILQVSYQLRGLPGVLRSAWTSSGRVLAQPPNRDRCTACC